MEKVTETSKNILLQNLRLIKNTLISQKDVKEKKNKKHHMIKAAQKTERLQMKRQYWNSEKFIVYMTQK